MQEFGILSAEQVEIGLTKEEGVKEDKLFGLCTGLKSKWIGIPILHLVGPHFPNPNPTCLQLRTYKYLGDPQL
jgi:hypothetical protein